MKSFIKFRMATFSVKLDRRVKLKGDKYNVVIRIFDKKDFVDLKVHKMTEPQYGKIFKRFAMDDQSIAIRESCYAELNRSEKIYKGIGYLHKERIRERFYKDPNPPKSLKIIDLFEFYKGTTNNRLSTYERMSCSFSSLLKFKPELELCGVTFEFLANYEKAMSRKLKGPTIAGYIKDLRTIINHCIKRYDEFPKDYNNPFGKGGFPIKSNFPHKSVMKLEELEAVLNFDDFNSVKDEFALDMWQLLFYSNGINFIDALLMKWKDIDAGVIRFLRRKTSTTRKNNVKQIEIPIDDDIQRIIDRWGRPESKYVFGLITDEVDEKHLYSSNKRHRRRINKSLKSITSKLVLSVPLRLKTARENYATTLYRLGTSKDKIGEILGHSNSRVTEHYFGSLGVESVETINKLLPRRKS